VGLDRIVETMLEERAGPGLERNLAERELSGKARGAFDSWRALERIGFDGEGVDGACAVAVKIDKTLIAGVRRNPDAKCPGRRAERGLSRDREGEKDEEEGTE
jgi:hypothetical protein